MHHLIRGLCAKHRELGIGLFLLKLDIKKAYDTLRWTSIDDTFCARHMPEDLRTAYWRLHSQRVLTLRTGDGSVTFELCPNRGIPQGSLASPVVYACAVEKLLAAAEAKLA